ncbi:MAG: ribosome maturation factor RimP [Gammaproteobacteria bacterium]|jgi:ribosome maturation factor RimP
MVSKQQRKINDLLLPVVEAMGYEFVGCKYIPQGAYTVLRVYIDKEGGVTLDDCSKVSAQLSAVLDVEEPITGRYTLEVSSPGSDRPLFTLEHFQRFVGHNVAIRLHTPIDGRRNFKGKVVSVDDSVITIDVDGEIFKLSFDTIELSNLYE